MDILMFLIVSSVGVFAYIIGKSSSPQPLTTLSSLINSKVFYCITYESIILYQLVFNQIVKVVPTTTDTIISNYDIIKIDEIKNEFPFSKSINTAYLAIMFQQYLVADVIDREMYRDQWVKLCTHQKAYEFANFFPVAEHFSSLLDRASHVLDTPKIRLDSPL